MLLAAVLPFVPIFTFEESYFTIWMQGSKIGYSAFSSSPTTFKGSPAEKATTRTEIDIELLGTSVKMSINSETITVKGKPVQMHFAQSSAGRTQIVDAWFSPASIRVEANNNGAKSKKIITTPKDGNVVDDPVAEFALKPQKAGSSMVFYVLDPSTVTLVRNTAKMIGKKEVEIKGVKTSANAFSIDDKRMNTTVYTSGKGDVILVRTALASIDMDMMPSTKEEALEKSNGTVPDIADMTSVKPDRPINQPLHLSKLKLKLSGDNLPTIPSDSQQSATKTNGEWTIDINPTQLSTVKPISIAKAKQQKPEWVKPSMLIPANSPRFIVLAKEITKGKTDVASAALAIRAYVNTKMKPNAGIGILRDASEVLDAKEGVCRDYAILTTSLCRAANIPARLASGLVNFEGNFYYHAWVEVWAGHDWLGLDSVPPSDFFSASHVKLSHGNVDEAFSFTILANARMKVIEQRN